MNNILVPVDFSTTSINALSYAIHLFGSTDVEYTLIHTYEVSRRALLMKSIDRILEEDAQRDMKSLIKNTKAEHPDIVLTTKIYDANAVSMITSMGDSGKYDCIVMGTKGASGLKEVFVGSVAGGVISKTKAPVIIVPDEYVFLPLKEITFAVGSMPLSNLELIKPLRELAKVHSSKINVLHFADGKNPDLEEIMSALKDFEPSVVYTFGEGSINSRLNDYIEKEDVRLLCLIKSKKNFLNRVFKESVTMKQTFHSPIPLFIFHDF